jgi:hypothetical protein
MTDSPVNPTVRGWLDRGNAAEALLGRGDYFLRTHDYGDHDRVLVANQLLGWAFPDHLDDAAGAVDGAVTTLLDAGDLDGAVDVIWSYVLVAEDQGRRLPVDHDLLDRALDRAGMAHLERTPEDHVYLVKQRLGALWSSDIYRR